MGDSRLNTGVENIDGQLGGGFPPGSLVVIESESRSQSEILFHMMLHEHANGRGAAYITTLSTVQGVTDELRKSHISVDPADVEISSADPTAPVDDTIAALTSFTNSSPGERSDTDDGDSETASPLAPVVIIDSLTEIEEVTDRQEYQDFLSSLRDHQRNTGVIVVGTRWSDHETAGNSTLATNRATDCIFSIRERVDGGDIQTYLHIPKSRFSEPPDERFKLNMKGVFKVDSSRFIV